MSRLDSRSREVWAKVALFGALGDAVNDIFHGASDYYTQAQLREDLLGDTRILQTEFLWPEPLPNGWQLRMHLYGIDGRADYNALNELLLQEVDGVIYATNVSDRESLLEADRQMKLMVFNLQRLEYDLANLPIILHYHGTDAHETFQEEAMDHFLGIAPGSLQKVCTKSTDDAAEMCQAVNTIGKYVYKDTLQKLEEEGSQE